MAAIDSFLRWWIDELARAAGAWLPAGGRARAARFVLVESGEQYDCYRRERGAATRLGTLAAGDGALLREIGGQPVELRLDRDRLISKTLHLPAASRAYLASVVRHQLERLTPWRPEHLAYGFAVEDEEAGEDGQIAVRVVATSREIVADALARLDALGLTAITVGTAEDAPEARPRIDLAGAGGGEAQRGLKRAIAALLAVAVLGGGLVAVYADWRLYRLDTEAAALAGEIAARRQAIAARAGAGAGATTLAAEKAALPAVLLIDELARLLPEHTFLRELALDGRIVRLNGLSAEPAALIGLIEGSELFADARFTAPTVRVEGGAASAFAIEARVLPPPGRAP